MFKVCPKRADFFFGGLAYFHGMNPSLSHGVDADTAAGPSAGRYILRVHRASHRNSAQIRAEVELLLALKRPRVAGISCCLAMLRVVPCRC
jgi:hypothetical protein